MLASTIESSLRSNCAESLLASATEVRMVNTATTAAAASAEATATLVRNDAERMKPKIRTYCLFLTAPVTRPSRLLPQHVADAPDGVDDARHIGPLELAPQIRDEHVGHIGVHVEVVSPDQLEQPLPGQHHTGVLRQHGQQVEFPLGQVDAIAADEHQPAGGVDGQAPRRSWCPTADRHGWPGATAR